MSIKQTENCPQIVGFLYFWHHVKGSSQMFYNLYLHFIDTTMLTHMLLDVISTSDKIRMKMVYIQELQCTIANSR